MSSRWAPASANPLTKFGAATLLAIVLLLAVDPVSAGVAVALELLALPWLGVRGRRLWFRLALVVSVAVPIGVFTAWAGEAGGDVVLDLGGPFSVTTGSALLGLAITLRILAVALPGVLLLASTDPTDLADSLEQHTPLPTRFVVGALAGLRVVAVVVEDATALRLARRARGVRPPWTSPTAAGSAVLTTLALSLARARTLAVAMEARGFGTGARTHARVSTAGPADVVLGVGALAVVVVSTAAGVAAGTWRFAWA